MSFDLQMDKFADCVSPLGRNLTTATDQRRKDRSVHKDIEFCCANSAYRANWPLINLNELCLKITDGAHNSPKSVAIGKPMASVKDLTRFGVDLSQARLISDEDYEQLVKQGCKPEIGDVLIAKDGNSALDTVCNVDRNLEAVLLSSVAILRPNPDKLDSHYLKHYLSSPDVIDYLKSNFISGAAIPRVVLKDFKKAEIQVPPLSIQKSLASVLDTLDDRIALLRETNATLEAIAQALFKSWFVDFDPVHAKRQGRAPEGMDEATAALFPDNLEESDLGLVPKGWNVEPLTEVFDFKEGPGIRNWQYTNSEEGTRFINIRCIQDGDLNLTSANRISDEEANGKYAHFHLQAWDVVVSTSGTLGRSAIVRSEHLPLMLNTSVIRFRPIVEKMQFCFVYEYLNSPDFLFKLESMASGSVQKNFGPMHLKQIKLVCPSLDLVSHFETICRPLFVKVVENRARIDTLVALRDTLLPRLISGQLRMPEAELEMEEALACAC
jgi:type I restriction enzyme S subunit